jgi:hypothetical protein
VSADGSITLVWGGDERRFRLAIGQLRELQEVINKNRGAHPIGPWSLWKLVGAGDAWPDELREVIRLGLIGGGERLELVPGLIKRYVDERPLLESRPVAQAILGTALLGVPDDPVGKKPQPETSTTETTLSDSPLSTDQAQPSDSLRARSTIVPSGNSPLVSRDTTEPMAQTETSLPPT